MVDPAGAIDALTPDEQLDLLERLWERLSRTPGGVLVTDEQRAEIDRRLEGVEADVAAGRTWEFRGTRWWGVSGMEGETS